MPGMFTSEEATQSACKILVAEIEVKVNEGTFKRPDWPVGGREFHCELFGQSEEEGPPKGLRPKKDKYADKPVSSLFRKRHVQKFYKGVESGPLASEVSEHTILF